NDITLSAAIWPNDANHFSIKVDLCSIAERFETLHLKSFDSHPWAPLRASPTLGDFKQNPRWRNTSYPAIPTDVAKFRQRISAIGIRQDRICFKPLKSQKFSGTPASSLPKMRATSSP